jgi:enoyl-CoA hydratase
MERLQLISNHLSEPLVKTEILASKVAIITLNRSEKFNALNDDLMTQLNSTLKSLDQDPSVHVMILAGSGKHFCVGADVNQFLSLTPSNTSLFNPLEKWSEVLPHLKKPIIAAVHGFALGGGCEIAMMCDFIVCDKNAKFGQPEIKLAVIPGAGGTQRLPRAVGKAKAMDLILTADQISAFEAKELGLVSRVFEKELIKETVLVAEKIARQSLPAVAIAKKAVLNAFEGFLEEGIKSERSYFNLTLGLKDKNEGINALLSKKAPKFSNS